jgi:hypothetical protein
MNVMATIVRMGRRGSLSGGSNLLQLVLMHISHGTCHSTNHLLIGNEWHRILNDAYGIRKGDGVEKEVTIEIIVDKAHLLELIDGVFGVKFVETDGIDRYLD